MGSLREKVEIECQNIEAARSALPLDRPCTTLSPLELAGTAARLHGFYSGVENI